MVESVDKRDDRDGRTGGAEAASARDVPPQRTDDAFGEMSEKQTAFGGDSEREERGANEGASAEVAPSSPEPSVEASARVDAPDFHPVVRKTSDAEAFGARVIPFVPRNGVVRAAPLPVQVEPRFARPAAGASAYANADGRFTLPPAQPPPPSGYRRAASLVQEDEPVAPPRTPFFGGGDGTGVGVRARAAWESLRGRLPQAWSWRRALKYAALGLVGLIIAYIVAVVVLAVAYRWVNPPTSTLMLSQRLSGTPISQIWTPIDRISPNLTQAVILSEDGQFCRHRGVDWLAMKEAIEQSLDGNARGGSTISMQTVKNLFLWPSKSYVRKAIELPLAMGTELVWPKQRMLEIYLNIAEWGPGIFGAEAAARYHFGKSAAHLTAREASLLAVALPNPIERQAGQPGLGQQRLAERLQARMRRVPNAAACASGPRGNRVALGDPAGQRQNLPL